MIFKNLFKGKAPEKTPPERYLDHLAKIIPVEPQIFKNDSLQQGYPGVSSLIFPEYPEKGMMTAATYGLSVFPHPDWKLGRPELIISVDSSDMAWGQVVGHIGNSLRGSCPFSYGNTINFGEKPSTQSHMDAFLVFAPAVLKKEEYLNIDIGLPYKINIAGLYPIYSSELAVIADMGLKNYWHHPGFDCFSVTRGRIVI
jgi:hypothetical protein